MSNCVFCRIVAGTEPAELVDEWPDAIAIVPLNPVTNGHLLVIPRAHVRSAADDPAIAGLTAQRAAGLLAGACAFNLITSTGRDATQTVMHLHWHLVPRMVGDGLTLPWSLGGAR